MILDVKEWNCGAFCEPMHLDGGLLRCHSFLLLCQLTTEDFGKRDPHKHSCPPPRVLPGQVTEEFYAPSLGFVCFGDSKRDHNMLCFGFLAQGRAEEIRTDAGRTRTLRPHQFQTQAHLTSQGIDAAAFADLPVSILEPEGCPYELAIFLNL